MTPILYFFLGQKMSFLYVQKKDLCPENVIDVCVRELSELL